jgi:hypothetical protein
MEKKYLPRAVNVLFSIVGIGMAVLALRDANNGDLGKALMNAGAALAMSMIPLSITPRALRLPLSELANELVLRPPPLWQRVASGISWLLMLTGLFIAIFRN